METRTIRDFIKRRFRAMAVVAISGWLLFALSGIISEQKKSPGSPLILLGFALFAGAILASHYWIKCPKCFRRLAQAIGMQVAFSGKKAPNFCPYCGVNLDEPIPSPQNPADEITTPDKLIWK